MKLGFPRAIISCCILLILLSAYAYAQSSAAPELPGQQDIPIPQLPGATDSSDQSGLPDLSALTNDSGVSEPQRLPYEARWELFRLGDTAGSLLAILWMTPDQGIHAYAHRPGSAMAKPTSLKVAVTPDSVLASVAYPAGVLKKDPLFPEGSVNLYPETTPLFVTLRNTPDASASLTLDGHLNMLLCSDSSCWYVDKPANNTWTDLKPDTLPDARTQPWWKAYKAATSSAPAVAAKSADTVSLPAGASSGDSAGTEISQPAKGSTDEAKSATADWLSELKITPKYFSVDLEVGGLAKAILFGLIAGLILNFMPCVLPVISLKLSSLMAVSGMEDKRKRTRHFREHNLFFSLGILGYFLILGALFGLVDLAWGQLFQQAGAMMVLMALVFALGLSLFGVFDLPVLDLKTGIDTSKRPRLQALFTGLLATLLATPCSGPFLGGVLGWTLNRPPETVILVFFSIGLGMALPYIIMIIFPGLVNLFPKPGGWNLHLERAVGFFLMATALYLFTILPDSYEVRALVLLWCVGLASWIWGKWTTLSDSRRKRFSIRALALAVALGAGAYAVSTPSPMAQWEPFSQQRFRQELGKRPMMIDFTADWCPNCKFLEMTVLTPKTLTSLRQAHDLVLLQADMTQSNPAAETLLRKLGSNSIPVVALFPAGDANSAPMVLRDLFTTSQLRKALEQTVK